MKLPLNKEYQAKYMILVAWVADKSGLSEDAVEMVVDESYEKNLRKDLEDYCDKLYDGEAINE